MNQQKTRGIWPAGQWLPENSVEDAEISLMAKKKAIVLFNIVEYDADNFYVTLKFNWRPELIHLSTRRVKDEPRMFKSLDRLIAHIKTKYPGIREISMVLNRRVKGAKKDFKGPVQRLEDFAEAAKVKKQEKVEKNHVGKNPKEVNGKRAKPL